MRETVYLVVSRHKVERMTKNLPELKRGEIPVKVIVTVADSAFREPVIVREIEVVDWRDGIEVGDLELKESFITEEEAQIIRERRLKKMAELLEANGYAVIEPGPEIVHLENPEDTS
jgi:L-ascorbate metabolism protein UlaG (beta-lactamase superfamily)